MDSPICHPNDSIDVLMDRISSYKKLLNLYGSKLIEGEATFDELKLTAGLIDVYLKMSPSQHLDHKLEDDPLIFAIIDLYGVGNYTEAKSDLDEFSVVFN